MRKKSLLPSNQRLPRRYSRYKHANKRKNRKNREKQVGDNRQNRQNREKQEEKQDGKNIDNATSIALKNLGGGFPVPISVFCAPILQVSAREQVYVLADIMNVSARRSLIGETLTCVKLVHFDKPS